MNFEYVVLRSPEGYEIELVTNQFIEKVYHITDHVMGRTLSRSKRPFASVLMIPPNQAQTFYISLVDIKGWEVLEGKMI